MNKLLLLVPVLALAACAPTRGVPPVIYQGASADILATIAQLCPQIDPPARAYNYFTATGVTPTTVTCTATVTTAVGILNSLNKPGDRIGDVVMTFTALQTGNTSSVAGGIEFKGSTNQSRDSINRVFAALDAKFQRIATP